MKQAGSDQNCIVMFVKRTLFKGIVIIGLSIFFTSVYINVFQHPPPNAILANNLGGGGAFDASRYGPSRYSEGNSDNDGDEDLSNDNRQKSHPKFPRKMDYDNEEDNDNGDSVDDIDNDVEIEDDPVDDGEVEEIEITQKPKHKKSQKHTVTKAHTKHTKKPSQKKSHSEPKQQKSKGSKSSVKYADYWQKFIEKNRYVPIGVVYDKCENWNVQYGVVIMLPDKEFGGVKSRTFVNITLPHEIDAGQFNIEVKYNGKDLYDNYWEICEMEEDVPAVNRTFNCPLAGGLHHRVKDKHIPNYLPKGRYETKAWASDEEEVVFACGYSDFKI